MNGNVRYKTNNVPFERLQKPRKITLFIASDMLRNVKVATFQNGTQFASQTEQVSKKT
ncbi:hypothetical protein BB14905_19620 [Bacillus sp. B14905]|nr:hypothetical protein BB14905_19620 [Bacillus sp. B14905]